MVKGKIVSIITPEKILQLISSYDIYRYFYGPFIVNELTLNHFRGESSPSFMISNKNGDLHHVDFGDPYWRGNCFSFVKQIHNCDFDTALRIIDRDMRLGIMNKSINLSKDVVKWKAPKGVCTRTIPEFKVIYRDFNQRELKYWEQFYQGESDLKRENIFVPKTIIRNNKRLWIGDELTFCYWYPEIERWKIYRPTAPKRQKGTPPNRWKWDSSIPFDHCYGLKDIKDCKFANVTKGRKDMMVLKTALQNNCTCYIQAEDVAAMGEETISYLKDNSDRQIIIFDSDEQGKKTSLFITKEYDMDYCNVPNQYLEEGINDFPELARIYGIKQVTQQFKEKGFL